MRKSFPGLRIWCCALTTTGAYAQLAGNLANIASLASTALRVSQAIGDIRDVAAPGQSYTPYELPGGTTTSTALLGGGNLINAAQSLANCNPNTDGLCCIMPNYCSPVAACFSDMRANNLLDYVKAVPRCTCPAGYQGDGRERGTGCQNIDECATGEAECAQICTDLTPGYSCSCRAGYRLGTDHRSCHDVDECAEGTAACTHACINTAGSYECKCPEGFDLGADGHSCEDINECLTDDHGCQYPDLCRNTYGGYVCECPLGYKTADDNASCVDVNECQEGILLSSSPGSNSDGGGLALTKIADACVGSDDFENSQLCTNSEGFYQCSCAAGFTAAIAKDSHRLLTLEASSRASASVRFLQSPLDAEAQNEAYIQTVALMSSIKCEDIDECADPKGNPCLDNRANKSALLATCKNTPGSYECVCPKGYEYGLESGTCEDIDECERGDHDCSFVDGYGCTNTVGSYKCECRNGFVLQGSACVDIDECSLGFAVHRCADRCKNTVGSYSCACRPGFVLGDDGRSCVDIDECTIPACPGSTPCLNIAGSYVCGCPRGLKATRTPSVSVGTTWLRSVGAAGVKLTTYQDYDPLDIRDVSLPEAATLEDFHTSALTAFGCANVNECANFVGACSDGDTCVDRYSDYTCECPNGYRRPTSWGSIEAEFHRRQMRAQHGGVKARQPQSQSQSQSQNSQSRWSTAQSTTPEDRAAPPSVYIRRSMASGSTALSSSSSQSPAPSPYGGRSHQSSQTHQAFQPLGLNLFRGIMRGLGGEVGEKNVESRLPRGMRHEAAAIQRKLGAEAVSAFNAIAVESILSPAQVAVGFFLGYFGTQVGVSFLVEDEKLVGGSFGSGNNLTLADLKLPPSQLLQINAEKLLEEHAVGFCVDVDECQEYLTGASDDNPCPSRTQPCCTNVEGGFLCGKPQGLGRKRMCPVVDGREAVLLS